VKTTELNPRLALVLGLFFVWAMPAWAQKKTFDGAYPDPYPIALAKPPYHGTVIRNFYLVMRDGIKIAVTLHLPKNLPPKTKIPVIIHQTRYWRNIELKSPWSHLVNAFYLGRDGQLKKKLIEHGYAFIDVDTRGTGASEGTVPFPWTHLEVKDGAEIVDWAIRQPWCDGRVGTVGLSYSGTTAEFLLTNRHPAVKAAACLFSLYDVYDDIAFPGGVHNSQFTFYWNKLNQEFDHNILPDPRYRWLVQGVLPVDDDIDRSELRRVVQQHANYNVYDLARKVRFRDDTARPVLVATVDTFSPHRYRAEIEASGAALYSYSGWYDGAYPSAAIKRYLTMTKQPHHLMLGPWNHGGGLRLSPHHPGNANFNHFAEVLKFFDYYVKGIDNGMKAQAPIHYYTMGEEKWKTAKNWPPATRPVTFYPQRGGKLANEAAPADTLQYRVDTLATTGDDNRWTSLRKPLPSPKVYTDRALQDKRLRVFETAPLAEDLTLTGYPLLYLQLTADRPAATIFAYLEEVDAKGRVKLITEGCLNTIHGVSKRPQPAPLRVGAPGPAPVPVDAPSVPTHTFLRADSVTLSPSTPHEVVIDLQPTSYRFAKGSRIRLCLAGGDHGNFEALVGPPANLVVHTGAGTRLVLPKE
jgi:uncharacterized protein